MGTRKNMPLNIDRRRIDAKARQAGYDALTIEQKLAGLPVDGAKRQRARLQTQQVALEAKAVKDAETAAKVTKTPKDSKRAAVGNLNGAPSDEEIFDMQRKNRRK